MALMDRPLVLVNFQGVLGDFLVNKMNEKTPETKQEINLRPGALEGLRMLSNNF
jgi:hypothetical protein